MYSAFGVDHGTEISKKGGRVAGLVSRGRAEMGAFAERAGHAARQTLKDPDNATATLREAKGPFMDNLSRESKWHGPVEAARSTMARRAAAKDANAVIGAQNDAARTYAQGGSYLTEPKSTAILDNATVEDAVRATTVRDIKRSPKNILRGEKKVTTDTNPILGTTTRRVQREGNTFFRPMDAKYVNGEKVAAVEGKEGGLTGAGKVTFVGGPAAGAGLGGIALNERSKRRY